ncbi:MAG: calcium-binding protein [Alphaproteobacteria bacterium]|nr:calcium-binding protein [Alphaproteobacteria bacterium]
MATRTWTPGTTGDWYVAGNWTTLPPEPNDFPQAGDQVVVLDGAPIITAADSLSFGPIVNEKIRLGSATGNTTVVLQATGETFGLRTEITAVGSQTPAVNLDLYGTTALQGSIVVQGQDRTFTIRSQSDGTTDDFIIADAGSNPGPGLIAVSQGSVLELAGDQITNNGTVQTDGTLHLASGLQFGGFGDVEIEAEGVVSVDGSVGSAQQIDFLDNGGRLVLTNPAAFLGLVGMFGPGDRIELPNTQAHSFTYQTGNFSIGTLTLYAGATPGGTPLATLNVSDPAANGTQDFTLTTDSQGGTRITYQPQGLTTLQESLPFAAVGTTGQLISFQDLLTQAFGTIPTGYASYTLSGPFRQMPTESYWQQGPNGPPENSYWLVGGVPVTGPTTVSANDIGNVSFYEGNSIVRTAAFTVTNAANQNIDYNIWTVDPSVLAPQTGDATPIAGVPGSGTRFGRPDPADMVSSAYRYNMVYAGVLNTNNCNWIADNVAAGAGAVMPFDDASTDPADNVSGGFWRIVYRGSDPNPVQDWGAIVQPGDVVRLQWLASGGPHTTTIVGTGNPDGTVTVYDNVAFNSAGVEIIGVHTAAYWKSADPLSTTIYRLDPLHQYLINGTAESEFLQGSVFNNLIQTGGGADTITAGAGSNEIQGTAAQLDGITVSDVHFADTLDFTDLDPTRTRATLDRNSGVLTVRQDGALVASVNVSGGFAGADFFAASDGNGGTILALAPVDLGGYGEATRAVLEKVFAPLAASGRTTNVVTSSDGSFAAPFSGQYNLAVFDNPPAGGRITVPEGYTGAPAQPQYQAAIAQGSNDIVFTGPQDGHALLVGNGGNSLLDAHGTADTVVAGGGNATLFGGGDETLLVGGAGADTLVAGGGAVTLAGGSGGSLSFAGSGEGTALAGTGHDTIVSGAGAVTVWAGDGEPLVFGGSGGLTFIGGSGNATVVAGNGNATVTAGSGADAVWGGAGSDVLQAGSGNATLAGGAGADLFGFTAGRAGGSDVIVDFLSGTDHVQLQGYGGNAVASALAGATTANGNTLITLGDGTQVAFLNVTGLTAADFV